MGGSGTAGSGGSSGGTGGSGVGGSGGGNPMGMCTPAAGAALPTFKRVAASDAPIAGAVDVNGLPGDPTTIYVIQHFTGDVRVVQNGKLVAEPVAHVSVRQDPPGREQGLLSMTFSPSFASDRLFYLFYSAATPQGQSTIDEFKLTDATHATFVRNIFKHAHSHQYHNGGAIFFGQDKALYFSIGDNNADCGPSCAQMPEGDYGRIKRINMTDLSSKTFEFGLRNPWRWSFDPANWDVYIGDVGNGGGASEKFFYTAAGSAQGKNWGWAPGTLDNRNPMGTISTLGSDMGAGIGGRVYRGSNPRMAGACGVYFFGHLNGSVYTIKAPSGQRAQQMPLSGTNTLSGFGIDAAGELYMTYLGGQVFRIDAN
ncbi:MAG TPA: PQQ-dependent sugar dehydrogenase [Polyangiaceae bacterium]